MQGQAECREEDRRDLHQVWNRCRCGGAQESYCWNVEFPGKRGKPTSGRICPFVLFFTFPCLKIWRPAKDLEEGFISFTCRYSQLLDLVAHPCRLLYKVDFLHVTHFPFMSFSGSRRSSISGRLKGEPEATRAIWIRLKNVYVLANFLFKIQIPI